MYSPLTTKRKRVYLNMKLNYKQTFLVGLAFLSISAF